MKSRDKKGICLRQSWEKAQHLRPGLAVFAQHTQLPADRGEQPPVILADCKCLA